MRLLAALLLPAALAAADETHPLSKDKTGMRWILPFEKARETAKQQGRLLMIKPVAFGTSADGGW